MHLERKKTKTESLGHWNRYLKIMRESRFDFLKHI